MFVNDSDPLVVRDATASGPYQKASSMRAVHRNRCLRADARINASVGDLSQRTFAVHVPFVSAVTESFPVCLTSQEPIQSRTTVRVPAAVRAWASHIMSTSAGWYRASTNVTPSWFAPA